MSPPLRQGGQGVGRYLYQGPGWKNPVTPRRYHTFCRVANNPSDSQKDSCSGFPNDDDAIRPGRH